MSSVTLSLGEERFPDIQPRWWDRGEGWRKPSSLFSCRRDIQRLDTHGGDGFKQQHNNPLLSFPEASQPSLKVFLSLSKSLPTAMSPSCSASCFREAAWGSISPEKGGSKPGAQILLPGPSLERPQLFVSREVGVMEQQEWLVTQSHPCAGLELCSLWSR